MRALIYLFYGFGFVLFGTIFPSFSNNISDIIGIAKARVLPDPLIWKKKITV